MTPSCRLEIIVTALLLTALSVWAVGHYSGFLQADAATTKRVYQQQARIASAAAMPRHGPPSRYRPDSSSPKPDMFEKFCRILLTCREARFGTPAGMISHIFTLVVWQIAASSSTYAMFLAWVTACRRHYRQDMFCLAIVLAAAALLLAGLPYAVDRAAHLTDGPYYVGMIARNFVTLAALGAVGVCLVIAKAVPFVLHLLSLVVIWMLPLEPTTSATICGVAVATLGLPLSLLCCDCPAGYSERNLSEYSTLQASAEVPNKGSAPCDFQHEGDGFLQARAVG